MTKKTTMTRAIRDGLMARMATRAGADLEEAELRGKLPPEMRADMAQRCAGCSDPAGCARHLGTSGRDVPGYCRNADRFRLLSS